MYTLSSFTIIVLVRAKQLYLHHNLIVFRPLCLLYHNSISILT